jgi:hypothetical protein
MTKTEFYVRGRTSGWCRGPFKTPEAATTEAGELSRQKAEIVDIEQRVTVTRQTVTIVGVVEPA